MNATSLNNEDILKQMRFYMINILYILIDTYCKACLSMQNNTKSTLGNTGYYKCMLFSDNKIGSYYTVVAG